jgi:coproporphyrinogen III oxidase
MYDENGNVIQQWFGGGQDLTPYYLKKMQNISSNKIACDKHNPDFLSKYKKQCDGYFGTHIAMKHVEWII